MAYGHRLVTGGLSVALVLATACGGSSGNNVGSENDAGGGDSARGVDSGGDAAAPQDASSGTDGSAPVDGSSGGDSSEPAGDGGAKGTIACGMGTTCAAPAQVCCAVAKAAGDAGGGSSSCVAAGSCNGISISCEGTDNCAAGDKCCFGGGQGSASATCEPKCTGAQLCDKQGDCPPSERCRPVAELGGLGVCEAVPLDAAAD